MSLECASHKPCTHGVVEIQAEEPADPSKSVNEKPRQAKEPEPEVMFVPENVVRTPPWYTYRSTSFILS